MKRSALTLALGLLVMAGCGGDKPEDPVTESPRPGVVNTTASAPAQASPDSGDILNAARILPEQPTCRSELSLEADPTLLEGSQIRWFINGLEVPGVDGQTFTSLDLKKGDLVRAVLTKDGEETYTEDVTIRNSPPVVVSARLEPRQPTGVDRVYAEVVGRDLDGDTVAYRYRWNVNGEARDNADYIEGGMKRGDLIEVEIVPVDGTDDGPPVVLETTVVNTLPAVSDGTAEFDGATYRYIMSARDPDGDALQYALISGPEGMEVNPSDGTVTWSVPQEEVGTRRVEVDVSDGNGGRVRYAWDVAIQWDENK